MKVMALVLEPNSNILGVLGFEHTTLQLLTSTESPLPWCDITANQKKKKIRERERMKEIQRLSWLTDSWPSLGIANIILKINTQNKQVLFFYVF